MTEDEFWLEFFQSLALTMNFDKNSTPANIKHCIQTCSEIADCATVEAVRKGRLSIIPG